MVDEQLDQWKETLAGIDSLLVPSLPFKRTDLTIRQSKVAQAIADEIPPEDAIGFEELRVIYFPQLGMSSNSSAFFQFITVL